MFQQMPANGLAVGEVAGLGLSTFGKLGFFLDDELPVSLMASNFAYRVLGAGSYK